LNRLPRVRRLALIVLLGALVAGCGGEETVSPTAETVVGEQPAAPPPPPPAAAGDAEAGKAVFGAKGCGGCHTFEPAGSSGTTGPNLGELHADAAGQPVEEYVRESLENPNAYVVEGYQPIMPPFSGSEKELNDLVAFIVSGS
jgi:cytochrome c oxidase subunit 2